MIEKRAICWLVLLVWAMCAPAQAQTPDLSLPPLPEVGGLDLPVIPPADETMAVTPAPATPQPNVSQPSSTTSNTPSLSARASADTLDDLLPPAATAKPQTPEPPAAPAAQNVQPTLTDAEKQTGTAPAPIADIAEPMAEKQTQATQAPALPTLPAIPTEVKEADNAPLAPPSLAEEAAAKGVTPPPLKLPPMPEATAQALLSGQPLGADDEDDEEAEAELPAVKVVRKPTVRDLPPLKKSFAPLRHSFNYKRTMLPPSIYKREYSPENRHLPKATTREDYDRHLFGAVAANNVNATRAFLNMGKSVNLTNANGETLLMTAVRYGAVDTARLLLARGADPRLAGSNGMTALQLAEMSGQQSLAQVLRARGA